MTDLRVAIAEQGWADVVQTPDEASAHATLLAWTLAWHPLWLRTAGRAPQLGSPREFRDLCRQSRPCEWPEVMPRLAPSTTPSLGEVLVGCLDAKDRPAMGSGASAVRLAIAAEGSGKDASAPTRLLVIVNAAGRLATAVRALDAGLQEASPAFCRPEANDFCWDCLALGFAFGQLQLLGHHTRFTCRIDEARFHASLRSACDAAADEKWPAAREAILDCYACLQDARNHFYPVDIYLLDWALLSGQTKLDVISPAFAAGPGPASTSSFARDYWATGNTIRTLIDSKTLAGESSKSRGQPSDERSADYSAASGHWLATSERELDWSLLPADCQVHELQRGLEAITRIAGRKPEVYASVRLGLHPRMPLLLRRLGLSGALHAALDASRHPRPLQARTEWFGLGAVSVDAIGAPPLDAHRAAPFLSYARHVAHSIDHDYVATILFAHWLGHASEWYQLLRRVANQSPVLGRSISMRDYLASTSPMGQQARFQVEEYQSATLERLVGEQASDPISRWRSVWTPWWQLEAAAAMTAWSCMIAADDPAVVAAACDLDRQIEMARSGVLAAADRPHDAGCLDIGAVRLAEVASGLLAAAMQPRTSRPALLQESAGQPAKADFRSGKVPPPGAPSSGILCFNPFAVPQIPTALEWPQREGVPVSPSRGDARVPPFGFAWQPPAEAPQAAGDARSHSAKGARRLATSSTSTGKGEWHLANEYLRARIDPITGGLAGLSLTGERGNLLSQRIVYVADHVESEPDRQRSGLPIHARMRALAIDEGSVREEPAGAGHLAGSRPEASVASPVSARDAPVIRASGVIHDASENIVADFVQTYILVPGDAKLSLHIELRPRQPLVGPPWQHYLASRLAWRDPAARLVAERFGVRSEIHGDRFSAPLGYSIDAGVHPLHCLSLGLPFHRRVAAAQCDTLLVVAGESATGFSLALGIDGNRGAAQARAAIGGGWTVASPRPAVDRGWFMACGASNLDFSHWGIVSELREGRPHVHGVRIRVAESEGQATRAILRFARPIARATKRDFLGGELGTCPIEEGHVDLSIAAHDWFDLDAIWD